MKKTLICGLAFAGLLLGHVPVQAEEWGDISGQFVFDGDLPKLPPLVKSGDPTVKDASVCAAKDMPAEDLVIDAKSKGIANVFIYVRKTKVIHPDLKESKKKELKFDQKACRFIPHCMFVRSDQKVRVLSADDIPHNTHTYMALNESVNFLVRPNDREGTLLEFESRESVPMKVKCDIHPHMVSHWLVLDHPYAAVSDKDGKFKIKGLPAGTNEFRVWHERVGYLNKKFKVKVVAGKETKVEPVKYSIKDLTDPDA